MYLFSSLSDEYENIAEKALTTPANTDQLMELKVYIKKVEDVMMYDLEKKLVEAKNRLVFLVDYASFSPAEMRLNSNTFMWNDRMPAIFEEHKLIAEEKKSQYEEALKVCRLFMVCTISLRKFPTKKCQHLKPMMLKNSLLYIVK